MKTNVNLKKSNQGYYSYVFYCVIDLRSFSGCLRGGGDRQPHRAPANWVWKPAGIRRVLPVWRSCAMQLTGCPLPEPRLPAWVCRPARSHLAATNVLSEVMWLGSVLFSVALFFKRSHGCFIVALIWLVIKCLCNFPIIFLEISGLETFWTPSKHWAH